MKTTRENYVSGTARTENEGAPKTEARPVNGGTGMRVDVKVRNPNCPVRDVASRAGTSTDVVARSTGTSDGTVTEEFRLVAGAPKVGEEHHEVPTEVFAYAEQHVYRFTRRKERRCLCEAIEAFDRPVTGLHANNDHLYASFHALESEDVAAMVRELHDRFEFTLQRIVYADSGDPSDLVLVDRSDLTERQRTAIEAAHELGYFEEPKEANASEIADSLGVARSTFLHHLNRAQSKLLEAILEEADES